MAQYRPRPETIEAVQWGGHNQREVESFVGSVLAVTTRDQLVIQTQHGPWRANVSDWIIKGGEGDFYPCRADIFHKAYELTTPATGT